MFITTSTVQPSVMAAEIFMGIYFNLSFWYKLIDETRWGSLLLPDRLHGAGSDEHTSDSPIQLYGLCLGRILWLWHNGIHGRTYLMAHPGQEFTLGAVS